jgi:hypothetical protein
MFYIIQWKIFIYYIFVEFSWWDKVPKMFVLHNCNYKGFYKTCFLLKGRRGGGGGENMQMECFDCREIV